MRVTRSRWSETGILKDFVQAVAADAPPAGGAVAALLGALAAALSEMVSVLTVGKQEPIGEDFPPELSDVLCKVPVLRETLLAAVDRDIAVIDGLLKVQRLVHASGTGGRHRRGLLQQAWVEATEVSLSIAEHSLAALKLSEVVLRHAKSSVTADAAAAAYIARAAVEISLLNGRQNARHVDGPMQQVWWNDMERIDSEKSMIMQRVHDFIAREFF